MGPEATTEIICEKYSIAVIDQLIPERNLNVTMAISNARLINGLLQLFVSDDKPAVLYDSLAWLSEDEVKNVIIPHFSLFYNDNAGWDANELINFIDSRTSHLEG